MFRKLGTDGSLAMLSPSAIASRVSWLGVEWGMSGAVARGKKDREGDMLSDCFEFFSIGTSCELGTFSRYFHES